MGTTSGRFRLARFTHDLSITSSRFRPRSKRLQQPDPWCEIEGGRPVVARLQPAEARRMRSVAEVVAMSESNSAQERALLVASRAALRTGTLPSTFHRLITRRADHRMGYWRIAYQIERRVVGLQFTPARGVRKNELRAIPDPRAWTLGLRIQRRFPQRREPQRRVRVATARRRSLALLALDLRAWGVATAVAPVASWGSAG
jgi:hypothetical protein